MLETLIEVSESPPEESTPAKIDLTTEQRHGFFIEKWKVIKKGQPRWEKQAYEILSDGTRRDRRLGVWTLTTSVRLSSAGEAVATQALEHLRWLWNEALTELETFDRFHSYNRIEKAFLPCCPLTLKVAATVEEMGETVSQEFRIPITDRSYRWIEVTKFARPRQHAFLERVISEDKAKGDEAKAKKEKAPSDPQRFVAWLTEKGFMERLIEDGFSAFLLEPGVIDWLLEDGYIERLTQEGCIERINADRTITKVKRYQTVLATPISAPKKKRRRAKFRPSCPIHACEDWRSSNLRGISDRDLNAAFSQTAYLARNPDKLWIKSIPAQPVRGVLKELAEAWSKWRYPKSGDRPGKPHTKSARKGEVVNCLSFEDAKCVTVDLNEKTGLLATASIPKICSVAIPQKAARNWGHLPIANLKLVRRDTWELQLTTTEKILPLMPITKKTAIIEIVGKNGVLFIRDKREYRISVAEYLKLQTKIDALKATITRQKRAAARLRETDPNYKASRLTANIKKLRKWQRLLRVAAKNELVKLARLAVDIGGDLSVNDQPSHELLLKPAPIPDDPGVPSWEENNAELVAELNREKAQHRVGMFVSALSQKSEQMGRIITIIKQEKPKKQPKKAKQPKQPKQSATPPQT